MSHLSETAERLMSTDALLEAERITGSSYKDDEATAALGLGIHLQLGAQKQAVLSELDDTHWNVSWTNFLRIALEEGFVEVRRREHEYKERGMDEQVILHHPTEGTVINAGSYWGGESLNGATLYFNLEFPKHATREGLAFSGHFNLDAWDNQDRRIYIGSVSLGEGMRRTLAKMRAQGSFVAPWVERPWMSLDAYWDSKESSFRARCRKLGGHLTRHERTGEQLKLAGLDPAAFGTAERR